MTDYAVVKIGPKQYIVEAGKQYTVEKFAGEAGTKLSLNALARGKGEAFEVGKPELDKTKVEIEIVEQGKGEKVTSRIFKAKSRYRRTRGFRKQVTTFKVLSIK
ncbi:50S ribosomal protein L21 [Candidatus Dojkabacteria bacterium]|uniref:50S ribosomal protein L21 n=1 Tax=Candidatus Dojkabacteria bacterium TaxID=2099670 RepID=A0A955I7K7_9BACT|nr:50S ribosomal protein L21 [Candidatus Dojkabacteria bacterium]